MYSGIRDVCRPQRCILMRDQDACASSIQRSPPALLLQAMSMICLGCLQQIQGMPQVQVRLTLSEAIRHLMQNANVTGLPSLCLHVTEAAETHV